MSQVIIYHGSCFDGFTAAWVLFRKFGQMARYIPAQYGEDPPPELGPDHDVIIVDFSYKRAILESIKSKVRSLLVLDHHKTAEEDLKGLDYCIFDMERSGCGIAWDHFFGGARPWLVDTVEDRDLWRFTWGETTKNAMGWISTFPMDFDSWHELFLGGLQGAVLKGSSILKYIRNYGEKAMEHVLVRAIAGHPVPVVNMPYMNCSEHLDLLQDLKPGYPFVASYFKTKADDWQFSLRSRGDFDVSKIAKFYGGGGHKNAAGFHVTELPWKYLE